MSAIHSYDMNGDASWNLGLSAAVAYDDDNVEDDCLSTDSSGRNDDQFDDDASSSESVVEVPGNDDDNEDDGCSTVPQPLFIGCDDGNTAGEMRTGLEQVEPEQIVIKVEPELDQLTDADGHELGVDEIFEQKFNPNNFREFVDSKTSGGASSSNLSEADKELAAKIKQAFGSLSSRFVETPRPPPLSNPTALDVSSRMREVVVDQKEKCLNELLRLFPSIDYMEVLDVLVRHRWALGVSVRHLRSTLKATLSLPTQTGVAVAVDPVRHVISSFSVDHKREAAQKIEIKQKEKKLHELGTLFPMLDCLELQDVLVSNRWCVESSANYLKSNLGTNVHVRPKHGKCFKLFKSSDDKLEFVSPNHDVDSHIRSGDTDCDVNVTDKEKDLPTDLADKIKRAFSSLSSGWKRLGSESIADRIRVPDIDGNNVNDDDDGTMDMKHDKEKRLSELVALFPSINILILYDVVVRHNWSVKAAADYLNSRKKLLDCDAGEEVGPKNSNGLPKRKAAIAATQKLAVWNTYESVEELAQQQKRRRRRTQRM